MFLRVFAVGYVILFLTPVVWARQNSVPDEYFDGQSIDKNVSQLNAIGSGEDSTTPTVVEPIPVELNADNVEYSVDQDEVHATGHVIVVREENTLTCDHLVYSRKTNRATATGHVVLTLGQQGSITGDKFTFNIQTMKGKFENATIGAAPFFGQGESVAKVGPNQMQMERGYLTTCDHDKPHFRIVSKKIDVYPKDKVVARHVRLVAGRMPLMYIPRYTQRLDRKPILVMTPGYDKKWGGFLLTQWRHQLNPNLKTTIYLDYRVRKDVASGFGVKYTIPHYGDGSIKTYYMNERNISSRHLWEERLQPTVERERFRGAWRHRWRVNNRTDAIWQYYKLSDQTFLKDYFERERDRDSSPATYFLLTHTLRRATISFDTEVRVNRFESIVEKIPEIRFDLPNGKIGPTNFYWKSVSSYTNFSKKDPSPTELRKETMRVHTLNELSYPLKVVFIELTPSVGGRHTYYSKSKDPSRYNIVRGQFFTGASLSTKFFRIFDLDRRYLGIPLNKLRHIITPSVNYNYSHEPTVPSSTFDEFDSIEAVGRAHSLTFILENKMQTKRKTKTIDLLRSSIETDFHLKESPTKGSFNDIKADIEFNPVDWISFSSDSLYNAHEDRLKTTNFDLYINGGNYYWSFGKRWTVDTDDQITTEFGYTMNHKWKFRIYERIDTRTGTVKEQNYSARRDLHEWYMDISFNQKRGEGDEILVIFTMKAFPDITIDAGTQFNRRKAGSQSGS